MAWSSWNAEKVQEQRGFPTLEHHEENGAIFTSEFYKVDSKHDGQVLLVTPNHFYAELIFMGLIGGAVSPSAIPRKSRISQAIGWENEIPWELDAPVNGLPSPPSR